MSNAFNKFRARVAELRVQIDRGTARPTVAPRVAAFKTNAPTGGGSAPVHVPAKPPDAPGAALPFAATRGEVLPAPFSIPSIAGADSVTFPLKLLRREAKLDAKRLGPAEEPVDVDAARPKTRGDCFGGARPCPFVSCKFHLYLEVTPKGSLVINRPDIDVADLKASCSLDIADDGPKTLDEVGRALNVTRERARQLEQQAVVNAEKAFVAGEVRQFRGSCKAVCAMSGRPCRLPAHGENVKHHDGRKTFHLVALPDQVVFPERERLERVATSNPESAGTHG